MFGLTIRDIRKLAYDLAKKKQPFTSIQQGEGNGWDKMVLQIHEKT